MQSRNSRRDDLELPVRVPLGTSVPILLEVGLRRDPPPGDRLRGMVLEWLSAHAPDPIRLALREFVEGGGLQIHGVEEDELLLRQVVGVRCCRKDLERFLDCDRGVRILAMDRLAPPRPGLWAALAAARAISLSLDGLTFDASLAIHRSSIEEIPPHGEIAVMKHIEVLHSLDERGLCWMTTKGLHKFGLPDLEVQGAPPGLSGDLAALMNGAAQHLVNATQELARRSPSPPREILLGPEIRLEAGVLDQARGSAGAASNATSAGSSSIRLEFTGRGREGREPFLEICPPRGFEGGKGVFLHRVLKRLLGSRDEESRIRHIEKDDAAMEEAHRRAVALLQEVKRRFQRGLKPGEALLVKHGFPWGDGALEFMWVAINTWKGARLQGQLASDPIYRRDLRAGDPIELGQSEVFDWMIARDDRSYEGGFTNSLLLGGGQGE